MKLRRLIEGTVLYELVEEMYLWLRRVLPVDVGLAILILFMLAVSCNLYITGLVLITNPITLFHLYNMLKRV